MQFSDEFIEKWEHIIKDVDVTEVPLECIKKVIFKFRGNRRKTLNLHTLRRQGLDYDEIESVMTRLLSEHADDIRDVDFTVDVGAVAELVQPETDKILKGM